MTCDAYSDDDRVPIHTAFLEHINQPNGVPQDSIGVTMKAWVDKGDMWARGSIYHWFSEFNDL